MIGIGPIRAKLIEQGFTNKKDSCLFEKWINDTFVQVIISDLNISVGETKSTRFGGKDIDGVLKYLSEVK